MIPQSHRNASVRCPCLWDTGRANRNRTPSMRSMRSAPSESVCELLSEAESDPATLSRGDDTSTGRLSDLSRISVPESI